jgi:uncharacterized membrane protein
MISYPYMDEPRKDQYPAYPQQKGPKVTGLTRDIVIALDRGLFVFSRHWLLLFNLFILLYVGVPFLAPVFLRIGWQAPAQAIYTLYGPLCNQLGNHSWFLFGERSNYQSASFQAFTGIDPNTYAGLLAARAFVGNVQMGYKVAICERDVAIYGVMLLSGLIFGVPAVRRRLKPMPWWAWFLVGIVPMGIDGFWQMFTNFPYTTLVHFFSLLPYHESSLLDRSLTGGLFGLANAWLAYPYFEESMREAHAELKDKLARVDASAPKLRPTS